MSEQDNAAPCVSGEHRWSPTGVWDDGRLYAPCLRNACCAELELVQHTRIVEGRGLWLDGKLLDIDDDESGGVAKIVLREAYSRFDDGWLPEFSAEEDTIIDVGAHVGVVSIFLAKKYSASRIIAFEPEPMNFKRLVRNLKANGCDGRVVAKPYAISAAGGTLLLSGSHATNSGGFSAFTRGQGVRAPVSSRTLRSVLDEYARSGCTLLKMDCEGAEHSILHTDPSVLSKVRFLSGEFHINTTLEEQGYSIERLLELVYSYIPRAHVRVNACRISD